MAGEEIPREVDPKIQERVPENRLANESLQIGGATDTTKMGTNKGLEAFSNAKDILDPKNMSRSDIINRIDFNDAQIASISNNIPGIENKMAAVQAAMEKAERERAEAAIVAANNANK